MNILRLIGTGRTRILAIIALIFVVSALAAGIYSGISGTNNSDNIAKNFVEYLFIKNEPQKAFDLTNSEFRNFTNIEKTIEEAERLSGIFGNSSLKLLGSITDESSINHINTSKFQIFDSSNAEYLIIVKTVKNSESNKWQVQYYESGNVTQLE